MIEEIKQQIMENPKIQGVIVTSASGSSIATLMGYIETGLALLVMVVSAISVILYALINLNTYKKGNLDIENVTLDNERLRKQLESVTQKD